MVRRIETEVLVVGGGPVGVTLGMDLAWRGVRVTVAELRRRGEPPSVKCNHVSARSMEIFRRLGVAGSCARRACRRISRTMSSFGPRRPGWSWRASPSLPRGPLHSDRWAGHLVAHAGATAPHQSDLP